MRFQPSVGSQPGGIDHIEGPGMGHGWRVITVTGETFTKGPYISDHFGALEGSWGPLPTMYKALGGYTPNVPWMRLDLPTAWEMDGGSGPLLPMQVVQP